MADDIMGRFIIVLRNIRRWFGKLNPKRIWRKYRRKKEVAFIREKVGILSFYLDRFCSKRKVKLRKNEYRHEWKVKPVEFVDAYSLLLEIYRGEDLDKIQRSHYADYISYTAKTDDDFSICLTDKTRRKDTNAVILVSYKEKCVLKIYFQTDKKKNYADGKT